MNERDTTSPAFDRSELMRWLSYGGDTGIFTWRISPVPWLKAGHRAGSMNSNGYTVIRCMGELHAAHRLAWLFIRGQWPKGDIDHIDGRRDANAIANLRDVSRSVNQQNLKRARKDNRSGLLGVKTAGKNFEARINVQGRYVHLGTFETAAAAHAAYLAAKRQHHQGCTL